MRLLKISLVVLLAGVCVYSIPHARETLHLYPVVTVTYDHFYADAEGGEERRVGVSVLRLSRRGRVESLRANLATGKIEETVIARIAPARNERAFRSENGLRSHANFRGETEILGRRAFLHQFEDARYRVQTWYAPALGLVPLREIFRGSDGHTERMEATGVMLGD